VKGQTFPDRFIAQGAPPPLFIDVRVPKIEPIGVDTIMANLAGPRQSGQYAWRQRECQQALEPAMVELVSGLNAQFLDFNSLLHAILPAARAVGWREKEVERALRSMLLGASATDASAPD